jgi:hypothetical protein
MAVDAEGCLWSARWGGACLVRYDPDGREMERVTFSMPKVSCPSFGGADYADLYVTTAGGEQKETDGAEAGRCLWCGRRWAACRNSARGSACSCRRREGGVMVDQVRLGVVGACGRGGAFRGRGGSVAAGAGTAVCDTNREGLPAARERLGADHAFLEYDEMLASGTVDAVLLGTPMALHVPQAMAALEAGIHVLSEVTAGERGAEFRALATACRRSRRLYAMSENIYLYAPERAGGRLVRAGLFGMPYYAEGEYLHELKALNEETRWRRTWQTGLAASPRDAQSRPPSGLDARRPGGGGILRRQWPPLL